jgi:hypothetical protein
VPEIEGHGDRLVSVPFSFEGYIDIEEPWSMNWNTWASVATRLTGHNSLD